MKQRKKRRNRKKRIDKKLYGILVSLIVMTAAALPAADKAFPERKEAEYAGQIQEEKIQGEKRQTDQGMEAQIHFLDVGQGDTTLIKCGEEAMLIDAGENDKGTAVQLYLQKQGIESLKYLVLTHPDSDHIGGADVIITKFDIETVLMPDYQKDNKAYEEVADALKAKRKKAYVPKVGEEYGLGNGSFTILAPNGSYSDSNNTSIALLFRLGRTGFLFTGDAEEEAEEDILQNGLFLHADVYQAGHHGSATASTEAFLAAVDADYAVISCGEDNSYGHPHAEVLNRMRAMGMKVYRTDEQGSIVAETDGEKITWNCPPSETWKSGERKK